MVCSWENKNLRVVEGFLFSYHSEDSPLIWISCWEMGLSPSLIRIVLSYASVEGLYAFYRLRPNYGSLIASTFKGRACTVLQDGKYEVTTIASFSPSVYLIKMYANCGLDNEGYLWFFATCGEMRIPTSNLRIKEIIRCVRVGYSFADVFVVYINDDHELCKAYLSWDGDKRGFTCMAKQVRSAWYDCKNNTFVYINTNEELKYKPLSSGVVSLPIDTKSITAIRTFQQGLILYLVTLSTNNELAIYLLPQCHLAITLQGVTALIERDDFAYIQDNTVNFWSMDGVVKYPCVMIPYLNTQLILEEEDEDYLSKQYTLSQYLSFRRGNTHCYLQFQ